MEQCTVQGCCSAFQFFLGGMCVSSFNSCYWDSGSVSARNMDMGARSCWFLISIVDLGRVESGGQNEDG